MINLKKKNLNLIRLIEDSKIGSKILIYFSTKVPSDDYDEYEKNYTTTSLNPLCIKGYVSDIAPESLVWRGYGFKEIGAKKVICEEKYGDWFRKADKITIDGDNYVPYRDAPGAKVVIRKLPQKLISVIISKK